MKLNFQPFLAMFAFQKAKPAVLGHHFTQTDNTDSYLLNWKLSTMSSHVGTGLRQQDHPQASTLHFPGSPVITQCPCHLFWAWLSDVKEPVYDYLYAINGNVQGREADNHLEVGVVNCVAACHLYLSQLLENMCFKLPEIQIAVHENFLLKEWGLCIIELA